MKKPLLVRRCCSFGKKWSLLPQKNSVLTEIKAELFLDWLDRISLERGLQWWTL